MKKKNKQSEEDTSGIIDMFDPDDEFASEPLTLAKISKDLKDKVAKMSLDEIRFLVDTYYQYQKKRLHLEGQMRALAQGVDTKPSKAKNHDSILSWLHTHLTELEKQIEASLAFFAKRHPVCEWMLQFSGVGPIISAGMVGHLRIDKAPTSGHFWNFAGLNPEAIWEEGKKRPWNAQLKVLCYKMGESFVKMQCHIDPSEFGKPYEAWEPKTYYSHHFLERKTFEVDRNSNGYFSEEARRRAALPEGKGGYGKKTDAWGWVNGCYPAGTPNELQAYVAELNAAVKEMKLTDKDKAKKMAVEATALRNDWLEARKLPPGQGMPMIPPAHVHSIARRWVVKLFLSHLHDYWFFKEYGKEAPAPYALAIQGHAHLLKRPA